MIGEPAVAQAARYGEHVRLLEDAGLETDRFRIRLAWAAFRKQFALDPDTGVRVRNAYRDAYMGWGTGT